MVRSERIVPARGSRMCPQLRAAVLSLLGAALCFAIARAQAVQAQPTAPLSPAAISSAASLEPVPSAEPTIIYENGLLTISAYRSTLSDILRGIGKQTGAEIDIPPQTNELVVVNLGPGRARDVLNSLLAGSRFNYVIVGSNEDPMTLTKILLFPMLVAENISRPSITTVSAVQQPNIQPSESNDIQEAVQPPDNPQEPALPVRASQDMLQQRRQMVMEGFQQYQQPK